MAVRLRRRQQMEEGLAEGPDYALVGVLRIPEAVRGPFQLIFRRLMMAAAVLALAVLVVYIDRGGYKDAQDNDLSLLDCIYYATVSLSTTGYGDVTPLSPSARLINVIFITPLRVLFLIILISTTMAALTERSRQAFKIQRWRQSVRNHTVVVGYGTKGRTAVDAMLADGIKPAEIVVVDTEQSVLDGAASLGLVTVLGNATKSDVLRLAGVQNAASVIVAANRDDTAVLVTLTAREVAPKAKIVGAIRETDNAHLLRQSGADSVVISSETAGRLLGIARTTPTVVEMIEDLLTPDAGFAIAEREVERDEVGGSPRHLSDIVLAVVRGGRMLRVGTAEVDALETDDRLLYIRRV